MQGPAGATGATGATGAAGPAGRDAVVTCKAAKGKTKVVCTVKLAVAARASVRGVFTRGGKVVARTSARGHKSGRIALRVGKRTLPRELPARAHLHAVRPSHDRHAARPRRLTAA